GRMETQLLVKLKERETFQEYKISKDEGNAELSVKVVVLDVKKAGSWGWYGRSSSKISCDVTILDNKSGSTVGGLSVVGNPKYASVEAALEDVAVQVADYMREHK